MNAFLDQRALAATEIALAPVAVVGYLYSAARIARRRDGRRAGSAKVFGGLVRAAVEPSGS